MRSCTVFSGPVRPRAPLLLAALLMALVGCQEDAQSPTGPASSALAGSAPALAMAPNTWTMRTPYQGPEALGFAAGAAPNAAGQWIVYAFGGHERDGFNGLNFSTYNAATDSWGGNGTGGAVRVVDANGVAKIGNRLYFTGGGTYGDDFEYFRTTWAYDIRTDRLLQRANMPKAIALGVTGAIDGKLYVVTGFCSGETADPGHCDVGGSIRRLYRYDPATNTWVTRRQPPHFHSGGAGGVIDDKLYVVSRGALDVYDPVKNTWKTLATMPTTGEGRLVAGVLQSKLFVISWKRGSDDQVVISNHAYDPKTNTWKSKASPPTTGEVVRVLLDGQYRLLLLNLSEINPGTYVYTP